MPSLPVFTHEQRQIAHRLLALKVAHMMGRKLEEADWTDVYAAAKGIESRGWSNLNIDIMHKNLGVEQKMLCYRSKPSLDEACGTTLMHPALTRSIRIASTDVPATQVMRDVFDQYRLLIEQRSRKVREVTGAIGPIEMRTGWLLWQQSLRQFLYFEEPMIAPDPEDYFAEWRDSKEGARKGSRNLWIFELETGKKRYSVTTQAGAKIQPYFDVPPPNDPNLYLFTVIGENIQDALIDGSVQPGVRVWLTKRTIAGLERTLGSLEPAAVSEAILSAARDLDGTKAADTALSDVGDVEPLVISQHAYEELQRALPSVNDDHGFQLLIDYLSGSS